MIPIGDSTRRRRRPYVNYALLLVNSLVFATEAWAPWDGVRLIRILAVVPAEIYHLPALVGAGLWPLAKLVTAAFLHGSWLHLIGNMIYLAVFGDNVEDTLGHPRYLAFYILGGAVAGLAHVLANPLSTTPTIGASGAVAAVLGAYLLLFPRARVLGLIPLGWFVPAVRLPAWLYLGIWFALQLWGGLVPVASGAQGVAWWAHIGGFLAGLGLVRLLAMTPGLQPEGSH